MEVKMILGYGEVGQALYKLAGGDIHDPDKGYNFDGKCDVLNVCIPYSTKFVEIVKDAIKKFEPKLTIIHSTVKVGTTRLIGDVAYSFVRGKHPNMLEMIKHTKHIGAVDPKTAYAAKTYLESLGFKTQIHYTPESVEFGKLFDTYYYGVCVALIKDAKRMADFYNIDWKNIEDINRTYNLGVIKTEHYEYIRPQLIPFGGKIGGHCVVSNAKLLQEDFKSKLLDAIVEAE
jgi:UDP-N-acetyl-D-mannosaminuronate dehydrogenase